MGSLVNDAVDVYSKFSRIPSLDRARIQNNSPEGYISVYSEWTQKDLDRSEKIKIGRSFTVHLDDVISNFSIDIGSTQHNSQSPSGLLQAVLRKVKTPKGDDKQYIEIWSKESKILNIDVSSIEQHGVIYEDGEFGCWSWSHHETHLLYVAEKKRVKAKSFFDKKAQAEEEKSLEEPVRGKEFTLVEGWGEQLVEKSHPVICVLDVESGIVSTIDNLPDDVSPGQPIWCPNDLGILCVGRFHEPYRLGAIYCPIRKSALFYVNLSGEYECTKLTNTERAIRSPRFSPDLTKLVYLDCEVGGAHQHCSRLVLCDWSTKGIVPVIEVISSPTNIDAFPGIFTDKLRHRCWSADSKRVVFQTNWMSKREIVVVNVISGEVTKLTTDENIGAWSVLDIKDDLLLVSASSPNLEPTLKLGFLPPHGKENTIKWTSLSQSINADLGVKWNIHNLNPECIDKESTTNVYQYILLESKYKLGKMPLMVIPHGGPNSVLTPEYSHYLTSFINIGFSVLLINYRGSIGFGESSISSLIGKVGSQDVKDCHEAVKHAIQNYEINENEISLFGGSHGGFLTVHLIGQYPDFYKAAAVRNPVIDLVSMLSLSDIPDWVMSQTGLHFEFLCLNDDQIYAELAKKSPIRFVKDIKTPILIMVGKEDLRVPPSQGLQLFKALKTLNKKVKMLSYPGCNHPISKVDCEADAFVNSVVWLLQR